MEKKIRMNISEASQTCKMCKHEFHLNEHHMGLVFDDKIFICQDCQTNTSNQGIMEWTQNVMRRPEVGMPISLWLIHEQNKEKQPYIRK